MTASCQDQDEPTHQRPRETFRQAGIDAWNANRANGMHVTSEEADAWLGKLEAGQDVEPPECHAHLAD